MAVTALASEAHTPRFRFVAGDSCLGDGRILYGGSFDPPHLGHQAILTALLRLFPSAAISMIPAHTHAFGKELQDYERRLGWCRDVANDLSSRIEVSDVERSLDGSSLATVRYFRAQEPERRLIWVIGSDLVDSLPRWRGASSLANLVEFCVFRRVGSSVDPGILVDSEAMPDVSSTELREALAVGMIRGSALPEVLKTTFLKDNPYLDPSREHDLES